MATLEQPDPGLVLLADAAEWRLLSLLFQRPEPSWAERLEPLADELGNASITEAVHAARGVGEGQYLAILGPGGSVSPREAGHRPLQDPGRLLADLTGYYRAFRYDPVGGEPPDHISSEIGFAAFLRLKESYAVAIEQVTHLEVTRAAFSGFLEDHLSPFVESFEERINAVGGPTHLTRAAALTRHKIESLESLVEIKP